MDPFNQFLRNKIANFRRRTSPDLLFTELETPQFQPTRELAGLAASPINQEQRGKLNPQELQEEDERLSERADFLMYEKTAEEVMHVFSS